MSNTRKIWPVWFLSFCFVFLIAGKLEAAGKTKKIDVGGDSKSSGSYAITVFDRLERAGLGGYFNMGWESTNKTNSFTHQFGLQFSSQLQEPLLFNSELAFNPDYSADSVTLLQAWVDYKWSDSAVLRAGIVPVPFGRVNALHRPDYLETAELPLYAQYVVPATWRDSGVGFHGNLDIASMGFSYDSYWVNGLTDTVSTSTGLKQSGMAIKPDNNQSKAVTGRIGFIPFQDLEIGGSYYTGKWDANEQKTLNMVGVDLAWKLDSSIEILAEWAHAKDDSTTDLEGYYAEAHFKFLPEFLKGTFVTKNLKNPQFTLYVRYGSINLDLLNPTTKTESQCTLGLNYRPMESVVYKVEYEWDQGQLDLGDSNRVLASMAVGF